MPKIPLSDLKADMEIRTSLLGQTLLFKTTWGLFCPEEIDAGTKLLLEAISKTVYAIHDTDQGPLSILDIGCGYGPIGISLAKALPQAAVEMIDKDFVAVDYSNKNAALNEAKNAHAFLSNGFSHIPNGKQYDLIISNLPAKVSKEFFWILFGEAVDHLSEDGVFAVVVIKQLEIMVRKNFNTLFGNSEVIDRDKTYSVIIARMKK